MTSKPTFRPYSWVPLDQPSYRCRPLDGLLGKTRRVVYVVVVVLSINRGLAEQKQPAVILRLAPVSSESSALPVECVVTIENSSTEPAIVASGDHYPPIELRIWDARGVELTAWTRARQDKQVPAGERKLKRVALEPKQIVHFRIFVSHYSDAEGHSKPLSTGHYRFQVRTTVWEGNEMSPAHLIKSDMCDIVVK